MRPNDALTADMTIGRLARAGGVGVETIRYYQRRGLLSEPERTEGGGAGGRVRRYGEADAARLRFIRAAQAAGFTLGEIGELLGLDAVDDRARVQGMARARIAELDAQMAALAETRAGLLRLADRCTAEDDGPCPIVAAFEG